MKLYLKRIAKKSTYTIGKLYIDGKYECDTIEDRDRGLNSSMTEEEIAKIKVKSETAIPTGTYGITLNVVSPKFSTYKQYKKIDGKLPRLIGVKGFSGVLIHIGNSAKSSAGCILVGKNLEVGKVLKSTETFYALYNKLDAANKRGEKITLTIE